MKKWISSILLLAAGAGLGWGVPKAFHKANLHPPGVQKAEPYDDSDKHFRLFNEEETLDTLFEPEGMADDRLSLSSPQRGGRRKPRVRRALASHPGFKRIVEDARRTPLA